MPIPFLVRSVKNLSYQDTKTSVSWGKVVEWYSSTKAKRVMKTIAPYLQGPQILDVGFGAGTVARQLIEAGFHVTGLDVHDVSIYSDLKATLYDGHHFPFADKQFDTAVIIHVLHHCQDPLEVLQEALRCSKRVVFIEDTYRNDFEKAVVSFNDNIGNFEFYQHPYRTEKNWLSTLRQMGHKVTAHHSWSEMSPNFLPSRYCLFVVDTK